MADMQDAKEISLGAFAVACFHSRVYRANGIITMIKR